jgi:PAS domain S-box-containing protein
MRSYLFSEYQGSNSPLLRSGDSSSLLVSANAHDFGVIVQANASYSSLFGFTPSELIGKNVSFIMPAPYCDSHPIAMSHMFDSQLSVDDVDQRHRDQHCFVVHQSGHIVLVQITVRHVLTGSGSSLLGTIAVKQSPYQFAIINPQNCITSCTLGFAHTFELNPKSLHQVSVTSVFPNFVEQLNELSTSEFRSISFCIFSRSLNNNLTDDGFYVCIAGDVLWSLQSPLLRHAS